MAPLNGKLSGIINVLLVTLLTALGSWNLVEVISLGKSNTALITNVISIQDRLTAVETREVPPAWFAEQVRELRNAVKALEAAINEHRLDHHSS